ncbi:MAG: efflux RND transporter periplasmic adaptor subunit [Hyphomicrobiales bacterium]|nr:efflux RND transporter periplasmic adaptor subunit [Hyphomicrobiales bacterium]
MIPLIFHWRIAFALMAVGTSLACSGIVDAHEGHDHGEKPAALLQTAVPRLVLQSEVCQLVAVLQEGHLKIFLDRTVDNAPVTDAKISLTIGDVSLDAKQAPDGTYLIEGGPLRKAGPYEVIATISGPSGDDLLIGSLIIPGSQGDVRPQARQTDGMWLASFPAWSYALGFFLGGIFLGLVLRGGWKTSAAAVTILAFTVAIPVTPIFAHEGHDHGDDKKAASTTALMGDVPRRLEDGSLFVPKPTQRLLDVRTAVVKTSSVQPGLRLIGRIIADPNRSGLVQSVNGGRISAPAGGLPKLGQTVKKGEVLAEIEPPIATGDYSDLAERSGEIDQQIALAEAKIARFERLIASNAVAQASLDDAKVELDGLKRRKATIKNTQREREVLRAPVDGVIATATAVPGQVVEARDVLFQVIAPSSFWVEALAFDPRNAEGITGGYAVLEGGKPLKLMFQGKGRALQQHATQLQFAVETAENLSVGLPATVLAQRDKTVTGKVLPREAVVRGPNGETLVFEHLEPERFMPRLVRIEPVDGQSVLVIGGVDEGTRVVVRSAEMLNQVR